MRRLPGGNPAHAAEAEVADRLLGQPQVISASCSASDEHVVFASVSSNGFEGADESTTQWIGADVTLRDEGDRRPEGGM
uniref:hypothetical protein n=1 Tax=Piscinibacter sp. TaxID=1903157 RepID=UPI0037849105